MKRHRSLGNEEAIVDSASRLVVIYRLGSMGAPAAAEMKTKQGTFWEDASWARVIAGKNSFNTRPFLAQRKFSYLSLGSSAHKSTVRLSPAAPKLLPLSFPMDSDSHPWLH